MASGKLLLAQITCLKSILYTNNNFSALHHMIINLAKIIQLYFAIRSVSSELEFGIFISTVGYSTTWQKCRKKKKEKKENFIFEA